jgi:hypothetical protein
MTEKEEKLSQLLEVYSFAEILEISGVSEIEVLEFLIEQDFIQLPEVQPL